MIAAGVDGRRREKWAGCFQGGRTWGEGRGESYASDDVADSCIASHDHNDTAAAALTSLSQMIGRPWLYALGSAGGAGVGQMLELMRCAVASFVAAMMTPSFSGKSSFAQWAWLVSLKSQI